MVTLNGKNHAAWLNPFHFPRDDGQTSSALPV
jgi:hypothetical protein